MKEEYLLQSTSAKPTAFILDLLHFFFFLPRYVVCKSLMCELLVQMCSSRNPTLQSLYVVDVKYFLGREEASCQSVISIRVSEACERKVLNFNFFAWGKKPHLLLPFVLNYGVNHCLCVYVC